jgi:hypothetical protein
MLKERPEEQNTLFKEIMFKKLSVRETERMARRIAFDKVRRLEKMHDPELFELEEKFTESLGTRVHIEKREIGGKIVIDFFSPQDLESILNLIEKNKIDIGGGPITEVDRALEKGGGYVNAEESTETILEDKPIDDSTKADEKEDEDMYSIKNFSL